MGRRKPELLTKARAANLSSNTVNDFFETYTHVIETNGLQDSPERIFNLDEIGLGTDSRHTSIFVAKSSRTTYMKSPTCGKTMYTVLFCVSATGEYMPPFTIYKGLHLYDSWTKGGPTGALYTCSESGWMENLQFEKWMDHFINHVKHLQKPVLLIYDGHGSHMTYGTIKKAIDSSVIILCLPPHTSHALQPLDVGVFAPLKLAWKKILKNWFRESRLQNISKNVFPFLLKKLVESLSPKNAIKGFQGCGLYPINKDVVMHRIVMTEFSETCNSVPPANYSLSNLETCGLGPSTSSEGHIHISSLSTNSSTSTIGLCNLNCKEVNHTPIQTTVTSPLKDLKNAILMTLSPPQSDMTRMAIENSKRKRKRVQAKTGEVLTHETVALRLLKEQEERVNKKMSGKSKQKTKRAKKSAVCEQASQNRPTVIIQGKSISLGNWVLVKYQGKKAITQYIGQVIGKDGKFLTIKYLVKSKIGDYYTFPETDDVDEIEETSIIKIFDEPTFNNRGHYRFFT